MITPSDCIKRYGLPNAANKCMVLWDVPPELEIGVIPKRIYCNRDLVFPLKTAFFNLIKRGYVDDLKTWDGCFNIRMMRTNAAAFSLHAWGLAVDLNAFENQLFVKPKLSPEFVKCFTDAGFEWGGHWTKWDGMHFQLAKFPHEKIT
jgi:hypothetical protein